MFRERVLDGGIGQREFTLVPSRLKHYSVCSPVSHESANPGLSSAAFTPPLVREKSRENNSIKWKEEATSLDRGSP